MTLFQAATYAFAAIGVVSVVYAVVKFLTSTLDEDGPIRVKAGSVEIENDDHDWEKDEQDGKNEFHYKGRPNRLQVRVRKNGNTCVDWVDARRVDIQVVRDGPGNDADVIFRANGAVRVRDEGNRFVATGKKLIDNSAGARVKKVVIKKRGGGQQDCSFGESDTYEVELKPLRN
jgi:hypothetical protein